MVTEQYFELDPKTILCLSFFLHDNDVIDL